MCLVLSCKVGYTVLGNTYIVTVRKISQQNITTKYHNKISQQDITTKYHNKAIVDAYLLEKYINLLISALRVPRTDIRNF